MTIEQPGIDQYMLEYQLDVELSKFKKTKQQRYGARNREQRSRHEALLASQQTLMVTSHVRDHWDLMLASEDEYEGEPWEEDCLVAKQVVVYTGEAIKPAVARPGYPTCKSQVLQQVFVDLSIGQEGLLCNIAKPPIKTGSVPYILEKASG
ncbi:hypothetical protein MMC21_005669 [Puttea exsequens]|nr:hypothetical protein [Puttea exsequens]